MNHLPIITALALGITSLHAAPEGIAGPLVGHTSPTTARIWMCAPAESVVRISYWQEDKPAEIHQMDLSRFEKPVVTVPGQPMIATIKNLTPATRYRFKITVDKKSIPAWAGSFVTAPQDGEPGKLRVAVTSCMKAKLPQGSWYLLLAQQPDIHLTLGDTHYADTTDPTIQFQHHYNYRRQAFFATVLRNVPTYSMWDDHDYGPNNSDGTEKGKEGSLAGWKQFWANPGAGTADTPGAFYQFTHGEVDFFVVDSRYHRSPDSAPDDDKKRMLGDAQFKWLMNGLKNSKAKFKVIASGSTLDHSKNDGWKIYTYSRHRLFDGIKKHNISGVMYMSGDIHKSLVWEHTESQERVGYPLVEVISSGITNGGLSFATVDFDTSKDDPTVCVRIVHHDGTVRDEKIWKLSQLGGK